MRGPADRFTSLNRYSTACERAAGEIIDVYSTSFGAATRMLGCRHRGHVRNIYALVRIADELVDGATDEARIPPAEQHTLLQMLEDETDRAVRSGYSSNPIVHAFARTARASGIGVDLTGPFFESMRSDLPSETTGTEGPEADAAHTPTSGLDDTAHARYVYGSAEVVGLMCLRVFLRQETRTPDERRILEHGARRLGAAFQNVNFLRDLADDSDRLGRSYLTENGRVDAELQKQWIATIREQLADASASLPLLPADARVAVGCALRLFSRLTDRLAAVPAEQLYQRRVRVPAPEKAWLAARAAVEYRTGRFA